MVFIEVSGGENVPGIPGAYATRNLTYRQKAYAICLPADKWIMMPKLNTS